MSPIKQETATDWEQSKSFLNHQIFQSLPYPTSHFDNQTIIVTGANSGLGLEAARYFVRLGVGKVILAVRSLEKGEAAAKSISESEKRDGIIEVWKLDLASYASVKEFAARASKLERLDVVVANAGVYLYDFMIAEDNESSITVNVISTFLLGLLLIPKLRETSQKQRRPKVFTVTGSFVHYFTKFPEGDAENILEELASKDKAEMPNRYNVSKAMQLLLVRALAVQLSASTKPGTIITSIIDPGFVNTEIMRHNTSHLFNGFMFFWRKIAGRSAEMGARTLVHAAGGGEETHGMYLSNGKIGRAAQWVESERAHKIQERLWTEVVTKIEMIAPDVVEVI